MEENKNTLSAKDLMPRSKILKEAEYVICGDREEDYGSPQKNFKLVSELWSSYLEKNVDENDVVMMMNLLKIARIRTGEGTYDCYLDIIGYTALGAEIMKGKS